MNGVGFYRWVMNGSHTEIAFIGSRIVPLHLFAQWESLPTSGATMVKITSKGTTETTTQFVESCVVEGVRFRHGNADHFRKATLMLRGKDGAARDHKSVFVMLDMDLSNQRVVRAKFSPVEFGDNGKPVLPYKGDDLAIFLRVVRALTLYPEKIIDVDGLVKEVKPLLLDMGHHIDFWDITASYWFGETDKLGITREAESNQHTIVMLPQEVEHIFGVSLFGP